MAQLILIIVLLFSVQINHLHSSTVLSTRTMTEKQGHDVVLACRFDRLSDRDRVMWSKDGVVLSVNQEISGDRNKYEIIGKYDLIVKKISSSDSGRYLCQNFDQAMSMTVVLNVLTRPSEPQLSQSNETLTEKNIGVFICSTYGGNPAPTFTWLINQQTINQSFVLVSPNISELRLPLEKRFDQSELTCQVMNKALDHPLMTSRKLNVQYKPEVNLRHGSNEVTNLNVLVIENDRLTLDCHVQSNPSSKEPLTWLKNGASLPGAQSSSLTLSNIKRSDEGEYTCLTSNIIGHGQASVHLRVQYAPIVRLNGGGVVQENQRLTLTCLSDSYPQIETYQWFKNDQLIPLTNLRSSLIVERVSKDDAAVYTCQAKNTLKYSNGTLMERYGRAQTRVLVEYAPIVRSITPIIAVDRFVSTSIDLKCEIDSYPESNVEWIYQNETISPSKTKKYSIRRNASIAVLTIVSFQSNSDYGSYRCHALNKLGNDSSMIVVRSKDVPQSPSNVTLIKTSYSSLHLQWHEGFDGGWTQTFQVSLNKTFINETNTTEIILNNLQHNQLYQISIRAKNRLGESLNETTIDVKTTDVPVSREDLPYIESSSIHLTEKFLDYHLNNESFLHLKIPLCLHIEIVNQSNRCERIVTSSGIIRLDEIDPLDIVNVSICLNDYEEFCGESLPVDLKREVSFNWLFILIASILIVFLLILCALCLFCFIQNCKRRRRHQYEHQSKKTISSTHPIVIEPISSPTKYLPSSSYVDQHSADKSINRLIVTTAGHLPSSASGSSDPIISNGNASSLSGSEQLTVTDFCPNDLSYKSYLNPTDPPLVSTTQTDLLWSQSQYGSYGFPFYPSNQFHEIVSTKNQKEDSAESGYSTPSKTHQINNKKTVYEVVV